MFVQALTEPQEYKTVVRTIRTTHGIKKFFRGISIIFQVKNCIPNTGFKPNKRIPLHIWLGQLYQRNSISLSCPQVLSFIHQFVTLLT
ncbi:hypothetical protein PSNVIR_02980 [Pseudomonas sp. Nvir]|nr:hypothetical protein PSNVIR_02980 [Pseudomonas sp. Nvir]